MTGQAGGVKAERANAFSSGMPLFAPRASPHCFACFRTGLLCRPPHCPHSVQQRETASPCVPTVPIAPSEKPSPDSVPPRAAAGLQTQNPLRANVSGESLARETSDRPRPLALRLPPGPHAKPRPALPPESWPSPNRIAIQHSYHGRQFNDSWWCDPIVFAGGGVNGIGGRWKGIGGGYRMMSIFGASAIGSLV